MILNGWLKRTFKEGDPLRIVANAKQQNRIATILETIQGVNCRIVKSTRAEGRGWFIVVDGSSDIPPDEIGMQPIFADNYPFKVLPGDTNDGKIQVVDGPFELIEYDGTGHQANLVDDGVPDDLTDEITSNTYIYLDIDYSDGDPAEITISAETDSSWPPSSPIDYHYYVLLAVDASETPGTDPAQLTQIWHGGGITWREELPNPHGQEGAELYVDANGRYKLLAKPTKAAIKVWDDANGVPKWLECGEDELYKYPTPVDQGSDQYEVEFDDPRFNDT